MALPQWFKAIRKKLKLVNSVAFSVSASVTNGTPYDIPDADRVSAFWVSVEAIAGTSATATFKLQQIGRASCRERVCQYV